MSGTFPEIVVVRHGQTAWSASGRHTGRTDIALTAAGEAAADGLGQRLAGRSFAAVWTSPSQRARSTAAHAGFGARAEVKPELAEWNYGAYEGRTTMDILAERPDWQLFRDGCPDGESAAEVGARADRIIAALRAEGADVLIFSSAHLIRVLAARWVGLPPEGGCHFVLDTASISVLGYEHNLGEPVIRRWNDVAPATSG